MAYENINVSKLKSSLNGFKTKLNSVNLSEVLSEINNSSSWQSLAKDNLQQAVNKLDNERYKELKSQIDLYLQIADKIGYYKGYTTAISSIQHEKDKKIIELQFEMSRNTPNQKYIIQIQNIINTYNSQIDEYNKKMTSLENEINGML